LDPLKRPSIDQIKKHRWMKPAEYEERYHFHHQPDSQDVEPHPQIVKLMHNLGIEAAKIRESISTDAYDNFHAIYLLLLERLKNSTCAIAATQNATDPRTRRRQSDAPRPRPPLNQLREHSTFQTTDCITVPTTTQPHYAHSDYEENCSTLSRQSTIGTIGSVDEGVESDMNGSTQSRPFSGSSTELLSTTTNESGAAVTMQSPFESFESQLENDIMSSLSSCQPNSEGSNNSAGASTSATVNPSATASNENSPCSSPKITNFGEGWRASDNAMFDAITPFPTGQLGKKSQADGAINRPSTGAVNAQMKRMRISTPASPKILPSVKDRRLRTIPGVLPKRISLPENLEFQPQVLLNIKQSIHVEKQMGGEPIETKQVLKARLQQKRFGKTRMQLFRQQSYQMAQKQSVLCPSNVHARLHEEPPPLPPLSPIEDPEETMES
jgi:hypothetical protein